MQEPNTHAHFRKVCKMGLISRRINSVRSWKSRIENSRRQRGKYLETLEEHRRCGRVVIHFLHIGKTGGTAVKAALKSCATTDEFHLDFHKHGFRLRDATFGDKYVFFVRDPLSRFVSGFNSRKRQGAPRYHSPWSEEEANAFDMFDTANDLALALSSPLRRRRKSAERAMDAIQHVRSFQAGWVGAKSFFRFRCRDLLFIGFQENLSQGFEELKHILSLPDEVAIPTDDLSAHRNPRYLNKHLDKQSKAKQT